jgi:protein-disulfide isomerase
MNLNRVVQRLVDGATVLLFGVAIVAAAQPGSFVRQRWSNYRTAKYSAAAALRIWNHLALVGASLGRTPGRAQVIEISDYECPFCRSVQPSVDSAVAHGVRVSFLHFAGRVHPMATGAALAALCAENVGRFPEMHKRLMGTVEWQKDSNWTREAAAAGIDDLKKFNKCLSSDATRKRFLEHRSLVDSLHISGTPSFISSKGYRVGAIDAAGLLEFAKP